jgi:CBS domain containing-hemolysin-like protein
MPRRAAHITITALLNAAIAIAIAWVVGGIGVRMFDPDEPLDTFTDLLGVTLFIGALAIIGYGTYRISVRNGEKKELTNWEPANRRNIPPAL